jgi:hypothetical protein
MPASSNPRTPPTAPRGVALRAALPGLALAGVGAGLGWGGVFGEAASGEQVGTVIAAGCAAAAVTGALGVGLKTRAVFGAAKSARVGEQASVDRIGAEEVSEALRARLEAQRFQVALFGDFLLNLFVLGIGLFVVRARAEADPNAVLMGFGLAFATVALLHQVGAALVLSSVLRRRAMSGTSQAASSAQDRVVSSVPQGPEAPDSHSSLSPVGSPDDSWAASATSGRTIHAHR